MYVGHVVSRTFDDVLLYTRKRHAARRTVVPRVMRWRPHSAYDDGIINCLTAAAALLPSIPCDTHTNSLDSKIGYDKTSDPQPHSKQRLEYLLTSGELGYQGEE